jgi:septal ring factor EnvC (AmiA/AmiB activator)
MSRLDEALARLERAVARLEAACAGITGEAEAARRAPAAEVQGRLDRGAGAQTDAEPDNLLVRAEGRLGDRGKK